ncbi:hypothetical protein ACFLTD_03255 [Elusimicrobiota bacterium]
MDRYLDIIVFKTGYGVTPETAYSLSIIKLKSYFVFLSLYKDLSEFWNLELQTEIKREEIRSDLFRQKNTTRLILGRSF